ncbi:patatin-like phospholipase domain-containing protein 2 [Striga asiatica]|uniref:Patatin-like phospholipase domain-containing protein 2 n=1 Tax=Striga asiatica TaxID=4170 RepID=A0A5A7P233_STRAF|nr:patatin-like phospholipase domain-containing protein 2 [Striga asiatica]
MEDFFFSPQQPSSLEQPSIITAALKNTSITSLSAGYFALVPRRNSHRISILCATNRRKQFGIKKFDKLVLESACVMASKLGFLPEPLGLLLRQCVGGDGRRWPWRWEWILERVRAGLVRWVEKEGEGEIGDGGHLGNLWVGWLVVCSG